MANRLIQRTTSGIVYNPTIAAAASTPAIQVGPAVVRSCTASSAVAAVWNIRDGILITDTIRLTVRVPAGQTVPVYLDGSNFSNGIYAELFSGASGEISVEFSGV